MNITTNGQARPLIGAYELTERDRVSLGYDDVPRDDRCYVRYHGETYPLADFQAMYGCPEGGQLAAMRDAGWEGYTADSHASGLVIRFARDGYEHDTYGYVIVGRWTA